MSYVPTSPRPPKSSCIRRLARIDEAADYFDVTVDHLLNQARKYKVGMVLAHQNLDQLSTSLRASIFASTSIKYAGGVSSRDATVFASEMRSEREFLESMRKLDRESMFACHVRNVTPQALAVSVPLGVVEREPKMSSAEWQIVQAANRAAYCISLGEVPAAQFRPARKADPRKQEAREERRSKKVEPPLEPLVADLPAAAPVSEPKAASSEPKPATAGKKPVPPRRAMATPAQTPPLGRGGKEHRYLQNLIKEFAISKGYHAVIEEEILEGAGRVDVSLTLKGEKIACEISVTTGRDHEFGNIEKCLGAGYGRIVFVSGDARHLGAMEKLADHHFEEEDRAKLHFASPEDAIGMLARWCGDAEVKTVRGYKVRTTVEAGDPAEQGRRRTTVASVIAKSLRAKDSD